MQHIQVYHECPISLSPDSLKFSDGQYALVHLLDQNEAYRNWFTTVNARYGAEVLLDNSIFELGQAFDSAQYAAWIHKLQPNYYIVPDVLESSTGTIDSFSKFTGTYNEIPNSISKIGVVQGNTWTDLVKCYRYMSENADYIAISFNYSYYEFTGYGEDKLSLWCSGRQRFIQQLIDEGIWNWNKPHHLLGASLAREFRYYVINNIHNIRSCDTSNPVVAALKGLRYNGDFGLTVKPSTKLADLINAPASDDIRELVTYNTSQFKRIINR